MGGGEGEIVGDGDVAAGELVELLIGGDGEFAGVGDGGFDVGLEGGVVDDLIGAVEQIGELFETDVGAGDGGVEVAGGLAGVDIGEVMGLEEVVDFLADVGVLAGEFGDVLGHFAEAIELILDVVAELVGQSFEVKSE